MSKSFSTTYKEIFKEDYQKDTYKMQEHSFVFYSKAGKSICTKCGLLALKNEFSRWSIDKGCFSDVHPQYQTKRKLTGFNT